MLTVEKNKESDANDRGRGAKRLHLAITAVIMVLIFVHSAMPADLSSAESGILVGLFLRLLGGDAERISFIVRKCAHFTEYTVLGFSLGFTVEDLIGVSESGTGKVKSLFLAWVIGTLYACTDEFHQIYVPGRSGELRDVGIDCCGVLTGVLLYTAYRHLKHRQQATPESR